jgi:hypothetical protein
MYFPAIKMHQFIVAEHFWYTGVPPYPLIQYPWFQLSAVHRGQNKIENERNKWFISFETRAMREKAVTW